MISDKHNGPEDVTVDVSYLLLIASQKESAEELLAYIAYFPSPHMETPKSITTTVRVATKTSVATVIKDEAGITEADGDDESDLNGLGASCAYSKKKRKVSISSRVRLGHS